MPKGKKGGSRRPFVKLDALSSEHRAILDSFLIADHSVPELATKVQKEWGYFQGDTFESLRRMLFRYKESIIVPKQVQHASKFSDNEKLAEVAAKVAKLEQRLDPIRALEDLIVQQMARVNKLGGVEKNLPSLMDAQTKNIGMLGDLLQKLIVVQMDTGSIVRVAKKHQIAAVDITEEERAFMEQAALNDAQAGFLVDAMRFMRQEGVIDVQAREIDERGTQGD